MGSPKILVAPLDWGLGHATRCIPIVNELIRQGCEIWIAAGGNGYFLLREQFPQLPVLLLEGYNVSYHKAKSKFWWTLVRQVPKIISAVIAEHRWLSDKMKEFNFDIVITDNRYGLYSARAYSVFMTHQLYIKTGLGRWADRVVRWINYRLINRHNECWVPDFDDKINLAGVLSHPKSYPRKVKYIGALSRFERKTETKVYDLMVVLSGPEPRRTIWEELMLDQLSRYKGKVLIVRGLPGDATPLNSSGDVIAVNFLPAEKLNTAIEQSDWIICRSGYSSVMDLITLQHKAILIPTPGQPEQEYLAKWLHQNELFYTCEESRFDVNRCLEEARSFPYKFSKFNDRCAPGVPAVVEFIQKHKLRFARLSGKRTEG
ncbi:MAG: glycosyl transferase family 28 [Chitinophagaceae bacterium]|nr:glycosyl transferase family 28 [Chitinophagaceae bacterium]